MNDDLLPMPCGQELSPPLEKETPTGLRSLPISADHLALNA